MIVQGSKVLVTESSLGRLYVYVDEHRSNRYLHIRYFFKDKNGDWVPGKKGIGIPMVSIKAVLTAIGKALGSG